MLFAIHCRDAAGAGETRLSLYAAHKAHLATAPLRIVISGPLLAEDGATMIGSLFVVEAGDRASVEAFVAADPFRQGGVWAEVAIHRFHMRVDNRA
jgi:uncharacterized protein YciI